MNNGPIIDIKNAVSDIFGVDLTPEQVTDALSKCFDVPHDIIKLVDHIIKINPQINRCSEHG